ncbi:ANR family transcriptional regulator [Escherichia coli]
MFLLLSYLLDAIAMMYNCMPLIFYQRQSFNESKRAFLCFIKKSRAGRKNMNLVSAFELWKQASLLCKNAENIEWCINRAMFCEAFPARNLNKK